MQWAGYYTEVTEGDGGHGVFLTEDKKRDEEGAWNAEEHRILVLVINN
jgi:hypothetical protein